PIGRMNRLVIKTLQIDCVGTVNREPTGIHITADRLNQAEILVLVVAPERGRKENERKPAAVAKDEHFEIPAEIGSVPANMTFVHQQDRPGLPGLTGFR